MAVKGSQHDSRARPKLTMRDYVMSSNVEIKEVYVHCNNGMERDGGS